MHPLKWLRCLSVCKERVLTVERLLHDADHVLDLGELLLAILELFEHRNLAGASHDFYWLHQILNFKLNFN